MIDLPIIRTVICSKKQVIDEILLKFPKTSLGRIQSLLHDICDKVSFIVEYPYVDRHYRDCYYFYYSSKFEQLKRDCFRIHIFKTDMQSLTDLESCKDSYAGYFIVRPLERFPLGRSMISPSVLKKNDFVSCLSKDKVHLLGCTIPVSGFPHIAQDTETHTCAESSLWSLLTYFSQKYEVYRAFFPSDIITKLNTLSNHKMLPSKGLTVEEIAGCLNASGQNCMLYYCPKKNPENMFSILQIYIESGMPVLLALSNGTEGHAVLAVGHEEFLYNKINSSLLLNKETWKDISFYKKHLVLIDDNMTPFDVVSIDCPAEHYNRSLKNMKITAFLVPFHKHMFMDALSVRELTKTILNDANYGLHKFGKKWITRLFLTPSSSFKKFLQKNHILAENIKELFLHTSFPKFIWICELYRQEDVNNSISSGILILDATGDTSLNTVIYYIIDDNRMVPRSSLEWESIHKMVKYKNLPYRNNLKGNWNQWKD